LKEPDTKKGFSELADKWDAEASALELRNGSDAFDDIASSKKPAGLMRINRRALLGRAPRRED
jgi:hypothetical protein